VPWASLWLGCRIGHLPLSNFEGGQHEAMECIIEIIDVDRLDAGFLDNLLFGHLRRLQAGRKVRVVLK